MKRSLLLAVSVLALTATSQQIFAAESETAAPQERAAPARERAAPARERAAPARQAPQRSAPAQSQTSSFTGSQAGGFGGGNAGGGGFADPTFCGNGIIAFSPSCGTTTQNIGRATGAVGGAEFGHMFAIGPYAVAGWAVDATGSSLKASGTQNTIKLVGGSPVNETLSASQRQPVSSTLRAKIGFVPMWNTMVYATAGLAVGSVSGDFNYSAINTGTLITANGSGSYNHVRAGYVVGGGVSYSLSYVRVTLEYLYQNLGTVTETYTLLPGPTCVGICNAGYGQTSMKTDTSTLRLKLGLPL